MRNRKAPRCRKEVNAILLLILFLSILLTVGCAKNAAEEDSGEENAFTWVKIDVDGSSANARLLEEGLTGRYFYEDEAAVFTWPSNGIEFGFSGTCLKIEFGDSNAGAAVYVDGGEEQYFRVREGRTVTAAEGLEAEEIHCVKIIKRSEPNKGNLVIKSVTIDETGEFYVKKYENQRKTIEVIGDSISCGYGNLFGKVDGDHIDMEDGSKTFATMMADYYGAQLSVCAISGIGIGRDDGYPLPVLPEYMKDGESAHDFTQNIPDIVIVELGTNDASCGNDGEKFMSGAKELISFVRSNYPDAAIIWYCGIMEDSVTDEIRSVVESFGEGGDGNIYYLRTNPENIDLTGEKGHPSLEMHEKMAEELIEFIENICKK